MSQKLKQLKEKLRRAIKQELIEYDNLNTHKEEELEESSMTGNIDGGEGPPQTPYAFQSKKKRGQDKKKEDEISTNSTGFIKMNENKLNELTDKQWTQALKHFIGNRYFPTMLKTAKSILKDRDEKRLEVFVGANYRYFKSMAKIYNLRLTEGSLDWEKKHFPWANKKEQMMIAKLVHMNNGIGGVIKHQKKNPSSFKNHIKKMVKKGLHESINEGRYHQWRNDESITPKQKIGKSIREVRDSLNGLSKTIDMSVKLKNELKVDSSDYWKTTHKALGKISERLVKLANKVGKLQ